MSWIAEYDTQGREFPTCVHVTKTTGTMTHGATYVPIEDGKAVRAENAKLRELVRDIFGGYKGAVEMLPSSYSKNVAEMAVIDISDRMRELGIEVD